MMGTLEGSIVYDFKAMDFQVHFPVAEESCSMSMYSPINQGHQQEDYGNPSSVQSLGSEVSAPIPHHPGAIPGEEQGARSGPGSVPCFMQLLEGEDDEKGEGSGHNLNIGTPYQQQQIRYLGDLIDSRPTPTAPAVFSPGPCYSKDDQIPLPCFDNKNFQPCHVDDLDLVDEVLQEVAGGEANNTNNTAVKQEPAFTPMPYAQNQLVTSVPPAKRKREVSVDPYPQPLSVGTAGDEEMSEAERVRKERRKASNRRAAKKCREKKLKEQNQVIQAKESCMAELEKLRAENKMMREIMSHCLNCCHSVLPQPCSYTPPLVLDPS